MAIGLFREAPMLAKGVVDVLVRYVLPGALIALEVTQLVETERARREVKEIHKEVRKLEGVVVGVDKRVSQLDEEMAILRGFNEGRVTG